MTTTAPPIPLGHEDAVFIRFIVLFAESPHKATGHVQSLIAGAVLFIAAMLLGALGVLGDLLAAQRTLSQRTFERVRRIELELGIKPSHYEPGDARRAPADPDGRELLQSASAGTGSPPGASAQKRP